MACQRIAGRKRKGYSARKPKQTAEERRASRRASYQKMKQDPDRLREWRIAQREAAALRRRAKGIPAKKPYRTMNGKPVEGSYFESDKRKRKGDGKGFFATEDTVDATNFSIWLNKMLKEFTLAELAIRSEVDARHLMRYATLTNKRVTLGFVDKVLVRNGEHLSSIYPDE